MKKTKSLNVLNEIKIDFPCDKKWESMSGGSAVRYCNSCEHSVNNLTALTKSQARKLLESAQGKRICVHFEKNRDGSVRYKAGPFAMALSLVLSLIGFVQGSAAQDNNSNESTPPPYHKMAGGITFSALTPTPAPTNQPEMGIVAPPVDQEPECTRKRESEQS